jgi:hypothetical protein
MELRIIAMSIGLALLGLLVTVMYADTIKPHHSHASVAEIYHSRHE